VLLWEYLLRRDEELDLSQPEAAKAWFLGPPWSYDAGLSWWTRKARSNWTRNLLALRSLALRLKGKRTARTGARDLQQDLKADDVLFEHVRMLRPVPTFLEPASREGLSAETWHGIMHAPGVRGPGGERVAAEEDQALYWRDDFDFFWQAVFLSLLSDTGPGFCGQCGRELPAKTKAGRPARKRICPRCSYRNWWERQPKGKRREKWRADAKKKRNK
jgi:hypothetical protein